MGSFATDIRSVPNLITLSRISLILVAATLYFYVSQGVGIAIAVVAGVTDYVDGVVARRTGQVTRLGEILDQFSDLCYESLVILVAVSEGFFPPLVLYIYLLREFWVSCLRRFMATQGISHPSSFLGKLKTNVIMWSFLPTFASIAELAPGLEPWLENFGRVALAVGLLFSYMSAWGYTRSFLVAYDRTPVGERID